MAQSVPSLLLHTCCAPCAVGCVDRLLNEGRTVELFYSNSNILNKEEFDLRLDSVRKLADHYQLKLHIDEYLHLSWQQAISGLENEREGGLRCLSCFAFSLERTARYAQRLNYTFCTSLTVSPHKNSSAILESGKRFDHFEPHDFKKRNGFQTGRALAREHGFYLQNFCGCEYSLT